MVWRCGIASVMSEIGYNIPHTDNMDMLKPSHAVLAHNRVTCNADTTIGDSIVRLQFDWLEHFKVKIWLVLTKEKTQTEKGQDLVWFKDMNVS